MITVGVDLAAEPKNTAVAVIEWTAQGARVTELDVDRSDESIVSACAGADKVGLDCPIGWPEAFVAFVRAHRDDRVTPPGATPGMQWRHPLANRLTDDVVHTEVGVVPLSVSADRIARPAMRAAGLLASLAGEGDRLDRTGGGLVVEVYPAASLRQWALDHNGYKGKANLERLATLASGLREAAPWLDVDAFAELFSRSDHAFDAVVAALTARAAAVGQASRPTAAQAKVAAYEGWIAVPVESLSRLVGTAAQE